MVCFDPFLGCFRLVNSLLLAFFSISIGTFQSEFLQGLGQDDALEGLVELQAKLQGLQGRR